MQLSSAEVAGVIRYALISQVCMFKGQLVALVNGVKCLKFPKDTFHFASCSEFPLR